MRLIASSASLVILLFVLLAVPHSAPATTLGIDSREGCSMGYPVELYLINEDTGTFEQLEPPISPLWRFCGIFGLTRRRSDGNFYAIGHEWDHDERDNVPVLIRIVPDTWEMITVGRLTTAPGISHSGSFSRPLLRGLAFSAADELYAHYYWQEYDEEDPSLNVLVRLNPETGAEEARVELPGERVTLASLDFAPDGTLYGWNIFTGLLTVDPATGVVTDVSPGHDAETHVISSIAFGWDGTLYGFGDYFSAPAGDGWIFTIDTRTGGHRRETYMGPGWFPYVSAIAHAGPRLPLVQRPPRQFWRGNLYLLDCMACPHCFGRMCDPRVNLDLDQLFLIEPKSGVNEILKRSTIGLRREDGPLKAGAPLKAGDKTLFVIAAPLAGKNQAGAVLFLDATGKVVSRFDGRSGETLGMVMDVRGSEVVVASSQQLVRFRGTKVVSRVALDSSLHARRSLQVAFTDDMDGDKLPEIRLGAPYATANGLTEAGVIQLIGSKTGEVLKTQAGKVARQHLGFGLPR